VDYLLAQVNIARMREPLDSPLLAGFVAALDPVNAAADAAPGFVWRLQTEDGNEERVIHLREFGPAPYAFTLKEHFPPPDAAGSGPIRSPDEWICPV
jgi:Domain of unknown function (DUF3291)